MKKTYRKPTMKVVDLPRQVHLLTQSSDQWLNYNPAVAPDDEKKLV